jgi:hypothetical protein
MLHEDIPRIPLTISGCWINTYIEQEQMRSGDYGYTESPEVFHILNV